MNVYDYIIKLVKCLNAPYVYGAKQNKNFSKVYSREQIRQLQNMYGVGMVWDSDLSKSGMTCCDCSGFVDFPFQSGYNSYSMFCNARQSAHIRTKRGRISKRKLKKVPIGAVLYQKGHVGVFIGWDKNIPYYIAEDGSRYNCRINKVSESGFNFACWDIYDELKLFTPKKYKVVRSCKGYTTPNEKRKKRQFKKGKKLHGVMCVDGHILCRKYSKNRDCWVSSRNLVELL